MSPVPPTLIQRAASLLQEVQGGARASAALGAAIAAERLAAAPAEELAALTYGALRRERRVRAVLGELSLALAAPLDARAVVVGAALIEQRLDVAAAAVACPGVHWSRFFEVDASVLSRASATERVALLGSLPDFLAQALIEQYAEHAEPLARSLSEAPPRSLRVNALKTDVAEARERLTDEGAQVEPGTLAERALVLRGAFNPFATRAFHAGLFELQDEGSQLACELLAPPPRGLVVDACAGAGGKSLAIAAALSGRGKVLALDVDTGKLAELRRRAKRAGAVNVQTLPVDETGPLPPVVAALAGKVDRLLVDAPCSGTGVLRRNPETRARLSPEAVARLADTQRSIIERLLPLLAPGGRLVFVTCSLLASEGEAVMVDVERGHPELMKVPLAEIHGRAYIERFVQPAPHQVRLLPHLHGTDGFFVSVLRRRR